MSKAYEDTLALKVVRAFERKNYVLDRGPGFINIFYIEGMDEDGMLNDNRPNVFNDLRGVLRFEGNKPVIRLWEATTEPGQKYVLHPINPDGAARIEFGQYQAWNVGMHRDDHEALIQTGGPVTVTRDKNKDNKRDGDLRTTGYYGINQHWGYNLPHDDIGGASAGCLVGRLKEGHIEFMSIVKSDPRYKQDHEYKFYTAIFPSSDII